MSLPSLQIDKSLSPPALPQTKKQQSLDLFLRKNNTRKEKTGSKASSFDSSSKPEVSVTDILGIKTKKLVHKKRRGRATEKLEIEKTLKNDSQQSWINSIQSVELPGHTWSPESGWSPGPKDELLSGTPTKSYEIDLDKISPKDLANIKYVVDQIKQGEFHNQSNEKSYDVDPETPPSPPKSPEESVKRHNNENVRTPITNKKATYTPIQEPYFHAKNQSTPRSKREIPLSERSVPSQLDTSIENVGSDLTTNSHDQDSNSESEDTLNQEEELNPITEEGTPTMKPKKMYTRNQKFLSKRAQENNGIIQLSSPPITPKSLENRYQKYYNGKDLRDINSSHTGQNGAFDNQSSKNNLEEPNSMKKSIPISPRRVHRPKPKIIPSNYSDASSIPYDELVFAKSSTSLLSNMSPEQLESTKTAPETYDDAEKQEESFDQIRYTNHSEENGRYTNTETETSNKREEQESSFNLVWDKVNIHENNSIESTSKEYVEGIDKENSVDKNNENHESEIQITTGHMNEISNLTVLEEESKASSDDDISERMNSPIKELIISAPTPTSITTETNKILESRIEHIVSAQGKIDAIKASTSGSKNLSPSSILRKNDPETTIQNSPQRSSLVQQRRVHFETIAYLKGLDSPHRKSAPMSRHMSRRKHEVSKQEKMEDSELNEYNQTSNSRESHNVTQPIKVESVLTEISNGAEKHINHDLNSEGNEFDVGTKVGRTESEGNAQISVSKTEEKLALDSNLSPQALEKKKVIYNGSVFKRFPIEKQSVPSPTKALHSINEMRENINADPEILSYPDPDILPVKSYDATSEASSLLKTGAIELAMKILESHTDHPNASSNTQIDSKFKKNDTNVSKKLFSSSSFDFNNASSNKEDAEFASDDFFVHSKFKKNNSIDSNPNQFLYKSVGEKEVIHLADLFAQNEYNHAANKNRSSKLKDREKDLKEPLNMAFCSAEATMSTFEEIAMENIQKIQDEVTLDGTDALSMEVLQPKQDGENNAISLSNLICSDGPSQSTNYAVFDDSKYNDNRKFKSIRTEKSRVKSRDKERKDSRKNESISFDENEATSSEEWKSFLSKKITSMSSTAKLVYEKEKKEQNIANILTCSDPTAVEKQNLEEKKPDRVIRENPKAENLQIDDILRMAEIEIYSEAETTATEKATSLIRAVTRSFSANMDLTSEADDDNGLYTQDEHGQRVRSTQLQKERFSINRNAYSQSIPTLKSSMQSNSPQQSPNAKSHEHPILEKLVKMHLPRELCGATSFSNDKGRSQTSEKPSFSPSYLKKIMSKSIALGKSSRESCSNNLQTFSQMQHAESGTLGGLTLSLEDSTEVSSYDMATLSKDQLSSYDQSHNSESLSTLEKMKYEDWEKIFSDFSMINENKLDQEPGASPNIKEFLAAISEISASNINESLTRSYNNATKNHQEKKNLESRPHEMENPETGASVPLHDAEQSPIDTSSNKNHEQISHSTVSGDKSQTKGETWSVRKAKINEILMRFDAAIKQDKGKGHIDETKIAAIEDTDIVLNSSSGSVDLVTQQ